MIKVPRAPKPKILVKKELIWSKEITEATTKLEKDKAISKYKHKDIKCALDEMFKGKCAFCESYIKNVDYGDIEHFQPKNKFPELAVSWDNLLIACKKCNGKEHKGEEWPLPNEGGPLINPCEEEPSSFFEFEFDEDARITFVRPLNLRAETSERIYGLNKDGLIRDRSNYVRKLIVLASYYHTDVKAREIIEEAVHSKSEYSTFALMVKEKYT